MRNLILDTPLVGNSGSIGRKLNKNATQPVANCLNLVLYELTTATVVRSARVNFLI